MITIHTQNYKDYTLQFRAFWRASRQFQVMNMPGRTSPLGVQSPLPRPEVELCMGEICSSLSGLGNANHPRITRIVAKLP